MRAYLWYNVSTELIEGRNKMTNDEALNMHPRLFPHISTIDLLHARVSHKDEINFNVRNGFTVGCYSISNENTFDDSWARECRGITFSSTGEIVSRSMHKFFNVNERESTMVNNIKWDDAERVMLKRDGSMIQTVRVGTHKSPFSTVFGKSDFDIKSKKSFDSDVANAARDFLKGQQNIIDLCQHLTYKGATAIFEFTAPTARIVVAYDKPEMQLLHVRDNNSGNYYDHACLKELCAEFDVTLVESHEWVLQGLLEAKNKREYLHHLSETTEDIEGWVFQLSNGEMYKLKTKWYMDRHHAMTFLRVRDIARMVVNESIDDLKSKLASDGIDITEIVQIETEVVGQINQLAHEIKTVAEQYKDRERKEVAMLIGPAGENYKWFKQVMQIHSGFEPDWVKLFAQNLLNQNFDLRQLQLADTIAAAVTAVDFEG
jgi:RNA ligase